MTGDPKISFKHLRVPLMVVLLTRRHPPSVYINGRRLQVSDQTIGINDFPYWYTHDLRPMKTGQIIEASDPPAEIDEHSEHNGDDCNRDRHPTHPELDRAHHSPDGGHDERQGSKNHQIDADFPEAQIRPPRADVRGQPESGLEWKERRHGTPPRAWEQERK